MLFDPKLSQPELQPRPDFLKNIAFLKIIATFHQIVS